MSEDTAVPARPGIAESSRWVLVGTALTKPLQLVTNIMLARMLAPAAFGTLNLANATAVTLSGIAGLGLGDAANRFMAENFRRNRKSAVQISSLIVWVSVAISLVFFGTAWLVRAHWMTSIFQPFPADRILGLCLLLGFVNLLFSLSANLFTGIQSFRDVTTLSVLQALLALALALPLGYLYGVAGALAGSVLGSLACIAWATARLCRTDAGLLSIPRGLARTRLHEVLHFSIPAWLALFVFNPVNLFTFSYLATKGGSEQVGIFNTANGFKMLVAMLPGLIGGPIGPAIIEEAGRHGRPDALEKLLDDAFAALAFLTLPLTIVLIFLSDLVFLVYGRAYSDSYRLFMPLTAGVAAAVLCTPMQFVLAARNRNWWLLAFSVAKSGILLSLAFWWIPKALSAGLAWAWFVAELSFAVMVVESSVRTQFARRKAAGYFYRYFAIVLLSLAAAIVVTAIWRWVLAVPMAAVAALVIMRRHPHVAIWISGALPPFSRPVARTVLRVLGGNNRQ